MPISTEQLPKYLYSLHNWDAPVELVDTIPGVAKRTAEIIVSEIGTDMSRFPSAEHLAAWAGLAPGNYESGA